MFAILLVPSALIAASGARKLNKGWARMWMSFHYQVHISRSPGGDPYDLQSWVIISGWNGSSVYEGGCTKVCVPVPLCPSTCVYVCVRTCARVLKVFCGISSVAREITWPPLRNHGSYETKRISRSLLFSFSSSERCGGCIPGPLRFFPAWISHESMGLWSSRANVPVLIIVDNQELAKHFSPVSKCCSGIEALLLGWLYPHGTIPQWKQLIEHLDGAQEEGRLAIGLICKFHSGSWLTHQLTALEETTTSIRRYEIQVRRADGWVHAQGLHCHILPCIMRAFCPNLWGKNKDAYYIWVVLIPYLYKCF